MQVLGNKQVLANFIRKQRALDKGSDLPIRPALIVLGGGMSGVESAGYLRALAEKAPDAPDVCAGVSAGAANLYGFLSGLSKLIPVVYRHLTMNQFIHGPWWAMRMEVDKVTETLRLIGSDKAIKHRSDFIVFATEYSSGEAIKIDAKLAQPDPVEAVRASMMAPGICSGVVKLDGKEYVDGACGMPFPIRHVAKEYRPTDILIMFNQPLPEKMGWLEWHLFPVFARLFLLLHGVPRPVRERTAAMDRVMAYELSMLTRRKALTWREFFESRIWKTERPAPRERKKLRWCIVAPEPHEAISQRCRDRIIVRDTGERAYASFKVLLAEVERELDQKPLVP